MKNFKILLFMALVITSLALTACDGGSGGSDGLNSSSNTTPPLNSGGVASAPAPLDLQLDNTISSNPHYNYFIYTATKNEKLIINTKLATALTEDDKTNCSLSPGIGSEPSSYNTQIHVYDRNLNRLAGNCGDSLTFTAPYNGVFILNLEYPAHSPGLFNATITKGDFSINEPLGTPSDPLDINLRGSNKINENTHYNYFKYSALKNERLIINASLATPFTDEEIDDCFLNPGTGTNPSRYNRQIHIYDQNMSRLTGICGTNLTFTAPYSGNFIINLEFPSHGPGLFNATAVKGDSSLPQSTGTPSDPITIDLRGDNRIDGNSHYNYFKYSARKDEKLIIHTSLTTRLSEDERVSCSLDPGKGSIASSLNAQIHIYDDNKISNRIGGGCNESLIFIARENGTYIFHFDFPFHAPGFFNASSIK